MTSPADWPFGFQALAVLATLALVIVAAAAWGEAIFKDMMREQHTDKEDKQ